MERRDWTLLVLDKAGPTGLSPIQLQKTLFLVGKNLGDEVGADYYEFVPYNYGPFDARVYQDAEYLMVHGFAQMVQMSGRRWSYYTITSLGHGVAYHMIEAELSERADQYLTKVVAWVQSLSFSQLLTAIYKAYPEYKAKSVFVA
jgi:uncharacterized protein